MLKGRGREGHGGQTAFGKMGKGAKSIPKNACPSLKREVEKFKTKKPEEN